MQRRALIIGCPDQEIPGVLDDMRNYRAFFESDAGGEWYSSEIKTLQSPSVATLRSEMQNLKKADYSIVVFAGHGGYSTSARATLLQLGPQVFIDEYELKLGASRHTVIIDACRVHVDIPLREEVRKSVFAMDSLSVRSRSRAIFDAHVQKCAPDLAVMYSCSIGQGAGDTAGRGGTYSSILLDESNSWASRYTSRSTGVLTVSDAHEKATPLVDRARGGRQTPTAVFPRNVPRFPFAICG
ncbi:caspase family protein [Burkholderia ubonensis]|nr:caspase family protein [Burkholderia ubonensis]